MTANPPGWPATALSSVGEPQRQHDRVADALRTMIQRDWQPGQALPSVRELMQNLRVSMPTLRAAQAMLQREGLLDIRHGRGVYVAQHARRWRVGIFSELDLLDVRTGYYFRRLASTVSARLTELDADPVWYNGRHVGAGAPPTSTCPRFWADLAGGRLDGAVVITQATDPASLEQVQRPPVPVVGGFSGYHVTHDSAAVAAEAVRELAAQGCRRVALMTWELREVEAAFHAAVAATGLTTKAGWIKGDLDPAGAGAGWDEFREIWATPGAKPDGLIVLDDVLFIDTQLAILEMGLRVPQRLRLVVQTNRGARLPIRLPITAFEVDPEPAGRALAETLVHRLHGEVIPPGVCHRMVARQVNSPPSPRRPVPAPAVFP